MNSRFVPFGDGTSRVREAPPEDGVSDSSLRLASELADRLRDPKSMRYFARVAAEVPEPVIRDALLCALSPSPDEIRNRAAYFTSLIEAYRARQRTPRPA